MTMSLCQGHATTHRGMSGDGDVSPWHHEEGRGLARTNIENDV